MISGWCAWCQANRTKIKLQLFFMLHNITHLPVSSFGNNRDRTKVVLEGIKLVEITTQMESIYLFKASKNADRSLGRKSFTWATPEFGKIDRDRALRHHCSIYLGNQLAFWTLYELRLSVRVCIGEGFTKVDTLFCQQTVFIFSNTGLAGKVWKKGVK